MHYKTLTSNSEKQLKFLGIYPFAISPVFWTFFQIPPYDHDIHDISYIYSFRLLSEKIFMFYFIYNSTQERNRTPKVHNLPAVLESIILTIANKAIGLRIQYILNSIIGFIYNQSKSMYILFIFLANINQLEDFFSVFYVHFVYEKNISYIF